MQIHELNLFDGTPDSSDFLAIDSGEETSKLPATALIDLFYPVGSYYETSDTSFDPNTTWGGTWVLETAGQVHVSAGSGYTVSGALTNSSDGGASTVTLTSAQMPSHTHSAINGEAGYLAYKWNAGVARNRFTPSSSGTKYAFASSTMDDLKYASSAGTTGGGGAHNNMQPYIVVKRWHRTA